MSRDATDARGYRSFGSRRARAAPPFGRLTWLGLSLSLIGWIVLIAVTALADALVLRLARSPVFHDDLVAIAKCLIASGFALAAIGTLQAGFGTLDRFFETVLLRSGGRAARPGEAVAYGPEPVPGPGSVSSPMPGPAPRPASGPTLGMPPHRPYRTYPDGSVEVETILGTRRFATMGDAREFI